MPGIVDVTYMSDREIKSLSHQDDPVEAPPPRRGRYVRPAPVMVDTAGVFTAAAVAHRINGGEYVKDGAMVLATTVDAAADPYAYVPNPKTPNRQIMAKVLAGEIMPTNEDVVFGQNVVTHYKGLTFKLLSGKVLNEFEQKSLQIASSETMADRDAGIVAALPSSYARAVKRSTVEDRLRSCDNSHIGKIGQKITVKGEVVRSVYSQQWATHYITMITDDNHAVFFGNKRNLEVGSYATIAGTVKAHRDGFQTQLNYTKII